VSCSLRGSGAPRWLLASSSDPTVFAKLKTVKARLWPSLEPWVSLFGSTCAPTVQGQSALERIWHIDSPVLIMALDFRSEPLTIFKVAPLSLGSAALPVRELCRRWRSNPSGKCSQERLPRGTVTSTMRKAAHPSGCARCGAGAGCSAIKYSSLRELCCGQHSAVQQAKWFGARPEGVSPTRRAPRVSGGASCLSRSLSPPSNGVGLDREEARYEGFRFW